MSVKYKDYYGILGISKGASESEIKSAYRKLAMKYHPDRNPGNKSAEHKFKEINEAYKVLSDPQKRKLYDRLGPNWQDGDNFRPPPGGFKYRRGGDFRSEDFGEFEGFSDFFKTIFGFGDFREAGGRSSWDSDFFGFDRRSPAANLDLEATLSISLEDLFDAGDKLINMGGRTIKVKIPKGVKDGSKIRLKGQGKNAGQRKGDLYLNIQIKPHHLFEIKGTDIEVPVKIMPWEAALGGQISVPTPAGSVRIKIPPQTRAGRKFRVGGRGMPIRDGVFGNLYARIEIDLPDNLTPRQMELFRKLSEEK